MMYMQVVRPSDDGMRQQVWSFWYYDSRHAIVLDGYRMESRDSKRKKFVVNSLYSRLRSRDATIEEDAVPLPNDVVSEAIGKFTESLRVARWGEIK